MPNATHRRCIDEAFGGSLTPCVFSRLNFASPSGRNFYIPAAAFGIYHALKIGLRNIVDIANSTFLFAPVCAQAKVLARDHGSRFHDVSMLDNSSSDSDSSVSSDSSVPRPPHSRRVPPLARRVPPHVRQLPAQSLQYLFARGPDLSINDHR